MLVTGTMTGVAAAHVVLVRLVAVVFDVHRNRIGSAVGPLAVLNMGQSQPFRFKVDTTMTPTWCFALWRPDRQSSDRSAGRVAVRPGDAPHGPLGRHQRRLPGR